MDSTILWDDEEPVTGLSIEVPSWMDQDVSPNDIAAIVQGGCASGAYMPAVTYHEALDSMREHGDEVFAFLEERDLLDLAFENIPETSRSWAGLACHFMSVAVEAWANALHDDEAFQVKVVRRLRAADDALRGYTDQEAYDHENPSLPDDPMETER